MQRKAIGDVQQYDSARFTKRILFKQAEHTVFLLNFEPGQQLPAHPHPGSYVYVHVIQGNGAVICDDVEIAVTAGDVIEVHGDEIFAYRSDAQTASSLYVVLIHTPNDTYATDLG